MDPVGCNWMETICGSPQEEIDLNAPPPKLAGQFASDILEFSQPDTH